jgi:hypothetical protein
MQPGLATDRHSLHSPMRDHELCVQLSMVHYVYSTGWSCVRSSRCTSELIRVLLLVHKWRYIIP